MSKFSVKKPFTVLVGVILVIVLGVVSFMNTSTDLLPSMNLPYAVVITTAPGMPPEQVESDITSPIENRMATVSGISSVTSTSSEHSSLVILEFTSDTNMDSASLEIRESLDMISLPDEANKPTIMKINPNMMPIMVSAVYVNDMDIKEVSALVEEKIAPALEGVPGVASASTTGLINHELHLILRDEQVEEVNERLQKDIQAAIDDAKAEAEEEAKAEMEKQLEEYSANRTAELMAAGMTAEMAAAQVEAEMPMVSQQMQEEMQAQMAAAMENGAEDGESALDPSEVKIPEEMLTVESIKNMLSAQNFSMPAGTITEDDVEYMVRTGDKYESIEEISDMVLFDIGMEGVEPVKLSDVAEIIETDNADTQYTRVNGEPAVMITMQKQTEFSTADLTKDVREKMDELSGEYDGLGFMILMDQGEYIDIIINAVINNLLVGALLAVVILIIFLRDIRPTAVVAISIPVSLFLAFAAMYFTGVSLNIISMSGLALAVGMLVDNSIVVIENIYRMRSDGVPAKRAAVEGAKQVTGAIIASTLTTIAVFIPIVFIQGITRELFTDLALTIAYSLIASLIVALTVVPAASAGVMRNSKQKDNRLFKMFRDWYARVLRGALRVKWLVIGLAVIAFGASVWGVLQKGTEFIPAMETTQISVSATMPEGSSFDDVVKAADESTERMQEIDDIESVGVSVGGSTMSMLGGGMGMGGGSSSSQSISAYVVLKENATHSNEEISDLITGKIEELFEEVSVTSGATGDLSMLTGSSVAITIEGLELDDIRDTAKEVAEIVEGVEGTMNVSDGIENPAQELRISVDKDKAIAKGLTVAQVYMAVSEKIENPEKTINMTLSGDKYDIIVSDGDWKEASRSEIEQLVLPSSGEDEVKVKDIAEVYEDTGFSTIQRDNSRRYVQVTAELESSYNVGLVNADIEKALGGYKPIDGCSVEMAGENEIIDEAFGDLGLMLALAIVFIYLIMVAQFQSLLSPFIVMFTIPLAFTGGFFALLIADMPLSVISIIGLVLLTGVVVNNGIVFIDFVNQLRQSGMKKKDALVEAGRHRLRPILMTALTTIVAMSTMTIGMGVGTEMVQPMAVTTVGGLLYATLMTLFVVPCMYDMFHRDRDITKNDDLDYDKNSILDADNEAKLIAGTTGVAGGMGEAATEGSPENIRKNDRANQAPVVPKKTEPTRRTRPQPRHAREEDK